MDLLMDHRSLFEIHFPRVRVIENGTNLRFSKGNNVGIEASSGEYILILNPDTIIHESSLDRWIEFADRHPEIGGFGCQVVEILTDRIRAPQGLSQRSGGSGWQHYAWVIWDICRMLSAPLIGMSDGRGILNA